MASKVRCKHCKTYTKKDTAVTVGVSSFCSEDHYRAWLAAKPAPKPRSTAPSAAARKRQRLSKVPAQVAEYVKMGDGYRCRLCGNNYGLALHHINYRSDTSNKPWMNEPWNLITLCNYPCHLDIVHGDKKTFKPLLLGLTWLREVEGKNTLNAYELEKRINVGRV